MYFVFAVIYDFFWISLKLLHEVSNKRTVKYKMNINTNHTLNIIFNGININKSIWQQYSFVPKNIKLTVLVTTWPHYCATHINALEVEKTYILCSKLLWYGKLKKKPHTFQRSNFLNHTLRKSHNFDFRLEKSDTLRYRT